MVNDFSNPIWTRVFEGLVDDIDEQRCVLFIGPEVIKINNVPLQYYLQETLASDYQDEIVHFNRKDGIFLFKDKLAKEDVQRAMRIQLKNLIQRNLIDESIFLKIASIPFHLVISINPDTFLSDISLKYGVVHRFTYFNHRGNTQNEVEIPTKTQPLFFNLCGSRKQDDSLILDYEDLFNLLQASLGSPGLPEKLRRTLQNAKSFLFIGFQFDNWYAQLLLRLLTGERAVKKFAIQTSIADADTQSFLVQQFQVQFLGDDQNFFDELYSQCKKNGLLKTISPPQQQDQQQVIKYLQNGELNEALNYLVSMMAQKAPQSDVYQQAILLSGRYKNLEVNNQKGILDYREYLVEFNKIIDSTLELNKIVKL